MKKKQHPPKPKEFTPAPFTALKGLAVKASLPSPAVTIPPPLPPPPEEDDDLDLFFRAVSDIRPLVSPRKGEPRSPLSPSLPLRVRKLEEEDRNLFLESLVGVEVRFQEEISDEEDAPPPLSASRLKQLRQGTIKIRMELDLHGLTRDEALESLCRFIQGAWQRELKAVLVITGKGNNSPGEPVLQGAVGEWLQKEGTKSVVEFAPAPRRMGGAGAFVVFLRPHGE